MAAGTSNVDNAASAGLLARAARLVGFLMFAVPAMVTLAGVVWLPAYAHYRQTRYERDCAKVRLAESQAWIEANDRLIEGLTDDPVLNMRILMSQKPVSPPGAVIVDDPRFASAPPVVIQPPRQQRPQRPSGRWVQLGQRLEEPRIRRGSLLLTAAALLAAMFFFMPAKQPSAEQRPDS